LRTNRAYDCEISPEQDEVIIYESIKQLNAIKYEIKILNQLSNKTKLYNGN